MSMLLETVLLKVLQRAGFIEKNTMVEGADLLIAGVRYAESNVKITDQILPVETVRLMPSRFGPENQGKFQIQQANRSEVTKDIYMAAHCNERWCRVYIRPEALEIADELKDKGYTVQEDEYDKLMKYHKFIISW